MGVKLRSAFILSTMILLLAFTGCFKDSTTNDSKIKVEKSGKDVVVSAKSNFAGAEVTINREINSEDVVAGNGNLVITKSSGGKTIVSVVGNNKALFTIKNGVDLTVTTLDVVTNEDVANNGAGVKRAGEKLLGDFDANSAIGLTDFMEFAQNYGKTYNAKYDIAPATEATSGDWTGIFCNSAPDGKVDIYDFIIFAKNYNKKDPTVRRTVTSVTVAGTTDVNVGATTTLTATVAYSDATTDTNVTWVSADSTVATVANGVVTGVKAGTSVITATSTVDSTKSGTKTVTVKVPVQGITIYMKKPTSWGAPNLYAYVDGTPATQLTGAWPGKAMEADGTDGWYKLFLAGATKANIIFNSGSNQIPGASQPGVVKTADAWYDGVTSVWTDTDPRQPVGPVAPKVSASPSTFTQPAGTYDVVITATGEGITEAKYTTNGTDPKTSGTTFTSPTTVKITLTAGSTVALKVYAKNSVGEVTETYTYKEGTPVKADFSWDNAAVYFAITDRFYNGDTSNDNSYGRRKDYSSEKEKSIGTFHGGDLKGMTQKINEGYFTNLGVNAIWFTAAYEQMHGFCGGGSNGDFPHYAYHGYYALDYTMIDKNMGNVDDMRAFVKAAHAKGIRVVMDVVMNHVGYNTALDASQYSFGGSSSSRVQEAISWKPTDGNWHGYHDVFFDYKNASVWTNWWYSWVRTGITGYTPPGTDDVTKCLDNLPDVRTDVTNSIGMAPILTKKWSMETGAEYTPWIVPQAAAHRKDMGQAPVQSIVTWLADWVREFGIDGYRCDTAKHIEVSRWNDLKNACKTALNDWRSSTRSDGDQAKAWKDDFWMVAEVYPHGPDKGSMHTSGGFDSVINFNFPKNGDISSIGSTWASYAGKVNADTENWNFLSYVNSHDARKDYGWFTTTKNTGTTLLLSPGQVQIYYGDETARPLGVESNGDTNQATRSDMNWGQNADQLAHWQKVGQFRNRHISVGAGVQTDLGSNTYGRSYTKNGADDKVVINLGGSGSVSVNVSGIFADGTAVKNGYNGETGTVAGGKVTFTAANGVILIEKQ